jgi:hypothetical protein
MADHFQQKEHMMKSLFELYRDTLPLMESVRTSIQDNERMNSRHSSPASFDSRPQPPPRERVDLFLQQKMER